MYAADALDDTVDHEWFSIMMTKTVLIGSVDVGTDESGCPGPPSLPGGFGAVLVPVGPPVGEGNVPESSVVNPSEGAGLDDPHARAETIRAGIAAKTSADRPLMMWV
jgi:hypothetical protein